MTTIDTIQASKRRPFRKKIEKETPKQDKTKKKKEDTSYLSSFYFRDIGCN
jgi:hypothetical protein